MTDRDADGVMCLYGSVVGMKQLQTSQSPVASTMSFEPSLLTTDVSSVNPDTPPREKLLMRRRSRTKQYFCDECEDVQIQAEYYCEDCDLYYCSRCNTQRHRKGKLIYHKREKIAPSRKGSVVLVNDELGSLESPRVAAYNQRKSSSSHGSEGRYLTTPKSGSPITPRGELRTESNVNKWTVGDVLSWLEKISLPQYSKDILALQVNGEKLMRINSEEMLEVELGMTMRLHRRKLLREIEKLRAESSSTPRSRIEKLHPNIHVDVEGDTGMKSILSPHRASPVAARNARIIQGQTDPAKGRQGRLSISSPRNSERLSNRRQSLLRIEQRRWEHEKAQKHSPQKPMTQVDSPKSDENALSGNELEQPDRAGTADSPLDPRNPKRHPRLRNYRPSVAPSGLSGGKIPSQPSSLSPLALVTTPLKENKRQRPLMANLALDLEQVAMERDEVKSSFNFSAEGTLQMQGFEINTDGITHTPFHHPSTGQPGRLGIKDLIIILGELGQGAGGKVYKAIHVPTLKLVAVKVVRIYDQEKRHQMVRELKSLYSNFVSIAERVSMESTCKHLVAFYDAYTNPDKGTVSIVLEYMDAGSLEDVVRARKRCTEKMLANIAYCVLQGLTFLHEKHQLHRDIKPSNILISKSGAVKISDFGISRDLENTLAKATTFTGTLLYMAPERISGGTYSYPSDIWSFGLSLMACTIGKMPLPTDGGYWGVVHAVQQQPLPRLDEFGSNFSEELCDFLDKCLRKDPHERPSARELLEHPFIVKNYAPFDPVERNQEPITPKRNAELEQIAAKIEEWKIQHANEYPNMINATNMRSVEVLADQLGMPHSSVFNALFKH